MHISSIVFAGLAALYVPVQAGLYPKSSPVMQITSKTFPKLIEKSPYTSIVEFYAPWCGHCQNLKPAYEKAAKSLDGLAQVAAVNCDEDENKPFCGQMGVQGFPTLKIVRPSKKPGGAPVIEDYRGERTAKAISAAVTSNINNHVIRITDKDADEFFALDGPKAVLFTEKGTTSSTLKAIAIDFLGVISIGQVRNKEKDTAAKFGIETFPALVLIPDEAEMDPVVYSGELKKDGMVEFLSQAGTPTNKAGVAAAKSSKKEKKSATSSSTSSSSSATEKAEETTPASDRKASGLSLRVLTEPFELSKTCLSPKSHTCILAFVPSGELGDQGTDLLNNLAEVYQRHKQANTKLFETFVVPEGNSAGDLVRDKLGLQSSLELVAINGKREWWRHFKVAPESGGYTHEGIEAWFDKIRMGEGEKFKIPSGMILGFAEGMEQMMSKSQEAAKEREASAVEEPINEAEEPQVRVHDSEEL